MRKYLQTYIKGLSTKKSCTPTPNTSKNQNTSSKQDLNMPDSSYQKHRPNTTSKKPPGGERSECVGKGGERSECVGRGGERTQCVGRGGERRECVRRGGEISVVVQNDFCAETQWQQISSNNLAKNQTKNKTLSSLCMHSGQ